MSLESLDLREVESAIEGILFASGEPLAIDRICLALDLDRPTAEQVLQKLGDYYAFERRGIRLIRMEDSYQLCSSPDYADVIRKAFEIRKTAKLSQPALEVLTIIAYYQPTTRAYVDQVRGWTAPTPWAFFRARAYRRVRASSGAGAAEAVSHNKKIPARFSPWVA